MTIQLLQLKQFSKHNYCQVAGSMEVLPNRIPAITMNYYKTVKLHSAAMFVVSGNEKGLIFGTD